MMDDIIISPSLVVSLSLLFCMTVRYVAMAVTLTAVVVQLYALCSFRGREAVAIE
jgi:hypothetical protein